MNTFHPRSPAPDDGPDGGPDEKCSADEDPGAGPEPAGSETASGSDTAPGSDTASGEAAFRADVRDALAGLAARLDREHERAAHREAVIDRLHDQARRESWRLSAPDLTDPPDPKQTALLLEAVADDVADALARLGVERFTVEPGAPYDASRHRPVAVTPVDDPMRDGTVTTVQSDGFEQSGKVLRKAAVSVGKHGDGRPGGAAKDDTAENDTAKDDTAKDKADDDPETASNGAASAVGAAAQGTRGPQRGETMNSGLGTDR